MLLFTDLPLGMGKKDLPHPRIFSYWNVCFKFFGAIYEGCFWIKLCCLLLGSRWWPMIHPWLLPLQKWIPFILITFKNLLGKFLFVDVCHLIYKPRKTRLVCKFTECLIENMNYFSIHLINILLNINWLIFNSPVISSNLIWLI